MKKVCELKLIIQMVDIYLKSISQNFVGAREKYEYGCVGLREI